MKQSEENSKGSPCSYACFFPWARENVRMDKKPGVMQRSSPISGRLKACVLGLVGFKTVRDAFLPTMLTRKSPLDDLTFVYFSFFSELSSNELVGRSPLMQ